MVRGRKPIPTAIQKMNGAYKIHPHRENKNEPQPPAMTPTRPDWLDAHAVEAWDHFSEILEEMGLLSVADEAALVQLCTAFSMWRTAIEKVQEIGLLTVRETSNGKVIERNRYELIARDWFDRFLKMLVEFGLTPSSRSRISVGKPSSVFNIAARVRE
jgi:P27 family predicted phage terminase small subunit